MTTEAGMIRRAAPGLTLMFLAPLIAEVLPGATRFSAIFVLPIEICVWGGGTLLIREAVRRRGLGWRHMLLLALALAVAEECLIQQTSLAPLVIQLKGQVYARSLGINYVYLLWALVYESVFVVFVPVYLTELIFKARRNEPWVGTRVRWVILALFILGGFFAWYTWTQIARKKVFHVPTYNPPIMAVTLAVLIVATLMFLALGPSRDALRRADPPLTPPSTRSLAVLAGLWGTLWYVFVVLAFGIAPQLPPLIAVAAEILLSAAAVFLLPRWAAHLNWADSQRFAVIFGVILGSMLVSFIGFIGSRPLDLYFKIGVDVLATVFLIAFYSRSTRVSSADRSHARNP